MPMSEAPPQPSSFRERSRRGTKSRGIAFGANLSILEAAGGHPVSACGDLYEGTSMKQETTRGDLGKMAAQVAGSPVVNGGEQVTYRHRKRGSIYEIIGHGKLQAADNPLDGVDLVFYRSVDTGDLWARPIAEFHDGRFEEV